MLEGQHLDLEFFFDQQSEGALGGFGSSGIRIEVHDHILAEASEQLGLQFGERGAGAGDHVLKSGGVRRRCSPSGPRPESRNRACGWPPWRGRD